MAVVGVAMAASSTPRPDIDRQAEAVARITDGDLGPRGLAAISARMDPAQLALAVRHDPNVRHVALLGLTPGWESLALAGKPGLGLGTSGLEAHRLNAIAPAAPDLLRPARAFAFRTASVADRDRALRCLTQVIYYEAGLEPTAGQEAVAQVVLNRVRDPNYPNSVCGVVYEGAERITGCQFSFTCDGALARGPASGPWKRARAVAQRSLNGYVAAGVGTATHYHADYVRPWWAPTLNKLTQIGAHIFYRWKGPAGETAAFSQAYAGREPRIDEARFARPRFELALMTDAAGTNGGNTLRTVEIDGQTRVVGVASLGGRRQPSKEEIATINARLAEFEAPVPAARVAAAPPGVTVMAVEEIGRPGR